MFVYSTSTYQRCCYSQYGEGSSNQGEVFKCTYTETQNCYLHVLVTLMCLPLQDFPWIVADEQEVHMQEPRLIPLKTMTSDIVKVSRSIPFTDSFNSDLLSAACPHCLVVCL